MIPPSAIDRLTGFARVVEWRLAVWAAVVAWIRDVF